MAYTMEQLKAFASMLAKNSAKDTDLDKALPLTGDELIPIVQDGKNRLTTLTEALRTNRSPIITINSLTTLEEAIKSIPIGDRALGTIISLYNTDADRWELHQYSDIGLSNFTNPRFWTNLSGASGAKVLNHSTPLPHKASLGSTIYKRDKKGRIHEYIFTDKWELVDANLENKACKFEALYSRDVAGFDFTCEVLPCDVKTKPYRRGNNVYQINECGEEEFLFNVLDEDCDAPKNFTYDITTDSPTIVPENTKVEFEAILYEGGVAIEYDHLKINGIVTPKAEIILTKEGSNVVDVTIVKGDKEYTKRFTFEVRKESKITTVQVAGDYANFAKLINLDDSSESLIITKRGTISYRLEMPNVEGYEFVGYRVNGGHIIPVNTAVSTAEENTVLVPIYRKLEFVDYQVLVNLYRGTTRIEQKSMMVTRDSRNPTVTFNIPKGYMISDNTKTIEGVTYTDTNITYRHPTGSTDKIVDLFIKSKPNSVDVGDSTPSTEDNISLTINPNHCYIDGSGTPSFSTSVTSNSLPYTTNFSVPAGVSVSLSNNNYTATLTYDCRVLKGVKPTVILRDELGRTTTIGLGDFKTPVVAPPTYTDLNFTPSDGVTVIPASKVINVTNQCVVGNSDESFFVVRIPYTGDYRSHELLQTQGVEITRENNMFIIKFICKLLNSVGSTIARIFGMKGDTWTINLGDKKPAVVPPTDTPEKWTITIRKTDDRINTNILGRHEFTKGSTIRLEATTPEPTDDWGIWQPLGWYKGDTLLNWKNVIDYTPTENNEVLTYHATYHIGEDPELPAEPVEEDNLDIKYSYVYKNPQGQTSVLAKGTFVEKRNTSYNKSKFQLRDSSALPYAIERPSAGSTITRIEVSDGVVLQGDVIKYTGAGGIIIHIEAPQANNSDDITIITREEPIEGGNAYVGDYVEPINTGGTTTTGYTIPQELQSPGAWYVEKFEDDRVFYEYANPFVDQEFRQNISAMTVTAHLDGMPKIYNITVNDGGVILFEGQEGYRLEDRERIDNIAFQHRNEDKVTFIQY